MAGFKICIGLYGLERMLGDDVRGLLDVVRDADQAGLDQVSVPDHVVMGENLEAYPYGDFGLPLDAPWYEPVAMLSALASVTERIRLSSGVLIAPLRPAVLLAKQAATLDALSGGRLDLGVGVGWQREEYEAEGLDFDSRWTRFDDCLRACRRLWTEAPVSLEAPTLRLESLHSYPRPVQPRLPIWFGVAPSARQAKRVAELGDGWVPMLQGHGYLKDGIARMRDAFVEAGRDPVELGVRAHARFELDSSGRADLTASIESAHELAEMGVTHVAFAPIFYVGQDSDGPKALLAFFEKLARIGSAT